MRRFVTGMLAAGLIALGCNGPSLSEQRYGDAHRENWDAMIANPGAGDQAPVENLDPRSAEYVLENYGKGQESQEHDRAKQRMKQGIVIEEMD